MSKDRINSAKGFLKNVKTGVIFPVYERDTIRNVEIDNLSLRKKGLNHQIKNVVVTKREYDAQNKPEKKAGRPKQTK